MQDEIIRMAREAGFVEWKQSPWGAPVEAIQRFAALVAAHEREKHLNLANEVAWSVAIAEREACAKVCEEQDEAYYPIKASGNECAAAIRARSKSCP